MRRLFLTSLASLTLDLLIPFLEKRPDEMTVAFIPTAGDPYPNPYWVDADRNKLTTLGFQVMDLDLKAVTKRQLKQRLDQVDIIFVAGGNTFYLLEHSLKSGFYTLVKELINKGVWYIGSSAGSVITGPDIKPLEIFDDPSKGQLKSTQGLGVVDFIILPHFKKEKYGNFHQQIFEKYQKEYSFMPITDNEVIIDFNGQIKKLSL